MPTISSSVARFCRVSAALSLAALALTSIGCVAETSDSEELGEAEQAIDAAWPGHVAVAESYVSHIASANLYTHNLYGSPASITFDTNNEIADAKTECASFTTLLLTNTYPSTLTTSLLKTLTGVAANNPGPYAENYYDGIDPALHPNGNTSGSVSLLPIDSNLATKTGRTLRDANNDALLQVGDLLASRYALGSITGHMMTVGSLLHVPVRNLANPALDEKMTLSTQKSIPGVTSVRRWHVKIYDSTSTVHNTSDSRYNKDSSEADGNNDDSGIGSGEIYLYENADGGASDGQLVGWTWSTSSAYTYEFTDAAKVDGSGKTLYRRMVIGRLSW